MNFAMRAEASAVAVTFIVWVSRLWRVSRRIVSESPAAHPFVRVRHRDAFL